MKSKKWQFEQLTIRITEPCMFVLSEGMSEMFGHPSSKSTFKSPADIRLVDVSPQHSGFYEVDSDWVLWEPIIYSKWSIEVSTEKLLVLRSISRQPVFSHKMRVPTRWTFPIKHKAHEKMFVASYKKDLTLEYFSNLVKFESDISL